eukprot:GFUD01072568.1.p1 GENE.GFUD01072568.1~~GFUD01072568.1.p1  ORF type:complete len:101 (+),score=33.20 GFUD01072568.1:215-517(+)
MLFSEKNMDKMFSKDNITALFSIIEKLDVVPIVALQSLILESAISVTKKKPAGRLSMKSRLSFLLTLSQVLFDRSKSFQHVENKKVAKMHKDLQKIVADY